MGRTIPKPWIIIIIIILALAQTGSSLSAGYADGTSADTYVSDGKTASDADDRGTTILSARSAIPGYDLSSFSLLATGSISLESHAKILSGNVGVTEQYSGTEITVGTHAFLSDGTALFGDTIRIRNHASAYDIRYNELDNDGTVRGTEHTPLSMPLGISLPGFPDPAPGTGKTDVRNKKSVTLGPGAYGEVIVRSGGTLVLTGGTYHFKSLELRSGKAWMVCEGETDLIIAGRLYAGAGAFVGPAEGSGITAADIRICANGTDTFLGILKASEIGAGANARANIFVPEGTLRIGTLATAEGAFVAKEIIVGTHAEITWDNGFAPLYVPPSVTSEPVSDARAGIPYTYQAAASGTGPFSFSLARSPDGMTILSDTGLLSWTPSEEQVGVHEIVITVTDGNNSDTQTYLLTVAGNLPDLRLSSFSVLATGSVSLEPHARILGGNVGVTNPGSGTEITVASHAYLSDGTALYGDTIRTYPHASAYDLWYNELIGTGTVRGTEHTPLPMPLGISLPGFPDPAPGTGKTDVRNKKSVTL
jgi:hypothetical protein